MISCKKYFIMYVLTAFAFCALNASSVSIPNESIGRNSVLKFFDKKGNIITIKSLFSSVNDKYCKFKKVELNFADSVCNADEGYFNIESSSGKLKTNIVYKNSKFSLVTKELDFDFNEKRVYTNSKTVVNFNERAELSSDNFDYDIKNSKMKFIKNVKLKIIDLQNNNTML